jgi:Cytochrome c7 and related cytochrome c
VVLRVNHESKIPAIHKLSAPRFKPRSTTFFRVTLLAGGLVIASTALGILQYYHSPYWNRIGLAPEQPVLFSHRHHAGELRIDCRFCHATAETSAFAGMPATQTCLNCHSQIFTDTAMLQPVVRSATENQPLAWARVTDLPDHVFFNHSIHLAKGVSCTTCHGELGRMALTAKAEPLNMRWCLDCHRDPLPRLQPRAALFAATKETARTRQLSRDFTRAYMVHPQHLTNCSTCHH